MEENLVKTSDNQVIRNEKGQVISGTPNPNGRPKGTKNFSTLFEEAIKKIAEEEGADTEMELVKTAIRQAKEGKYSYHKDIFDRVYGSPTQKTDITSGGEKIIGINYIVPDGNNTQTNE